MEKARYTESAHATNGQLWESLFMFEVPCRHGHCGYARMKREELSIHRKYSKVYEFSCFMGMNMHPSTVVPKLFLLYALKTTLEQGSTWSVYMYLFVCLPLNLVSRTITCQTKSTSDFSVTWAVKIQKCVLFKKGIRAYRG